MRHRLGIDIRGTFTDLSLIAQATVCLIGRASRPVAVHLAEDIVVGSRAPAAADGCSPAEDGLTIGRPTNASG
jgi:hypothetical protein